MSQVLSELRAKLFVEHSGSFRSGEQCKVRETSGATVGARSPEPIEYVDSDLADEVERRLERLRAFLPFRRANFARVRAHVLSGFHLAQELARVAADAVVVNLRHLDFAFGIDHEAPAQGETFFFDQNIEGASQSRRRIADEWVGDLLDGVRSVVPCLVREMRIGRDAIDLDA